MGNRYREIKLFPKQRLADRWAFVGEHVRDRRGNNLIGYKVRRNLLVDIIFGTP